MVAHGNTLASLLVLSLVIYAASDISAVVRTDVNGNNIDCGQGGASCRICGDINAIESSCQANPSCVAFTFDNSCGYLKSAGEPRVYREGFTLFIVTNKSPTGGAAASPSSTPPAAANTTPAAPAAGPVQVSAPTAPPPPPPAAPANPPPSSAPPASTAPAAPAPAPSPPSGPAPAPQPVEAPAGPIQVSAPSRAQEDDSGSSGNRGSGTTYGPTYGRTGLFPIGGGGFTGIGFPGRKLLRHGHGSRVVLLQQGAAAVAAAGLNNDGSRV